MFSRVTGACYVEHVEIEASGLLVLQDRACLISYLIFAAV